VTAVFPALTTARLELTSFDRADVEARHAYQGRSDVARYLYRAPLSREACATGIEKATASRLDGDGSFLLFAVRKREDRRVMGEVILTAADIGAGQMEIGWVFNPDDGGQGHATEAARAVVEFAFARAGAHRVFARLDTENVRSVALCERIGFRREAHLVENDRLPDGTWGSEFVYAALAEDLRPALDLATAPDVSPSPAS
jgi:RimJ/RimL family protein N-acetyltransferase